MEIVYLGLFQQIANWVFSKILSPIFSFISDLLTTVLSFLFENILAPILMPVLENAIRFFFDLWNDMMATQYYMLLSALLKLIEYLETAFDTFIGLKDVSYVTETGTVTGPLLEVLFSQKSVSMLFWALTLGGLAIALMLTIIATAKSSFDLDFENKRPVSRVLTAFLKTFFSLFTIPFFTYFILKLSMVILKGISFAMGAGGESKLSRMIFVTVSMNAAKNDAYNLSSENSVIRGLLGSREDIVRYPFYTGEKNYSQLSEVADVFRLADFDYLIGFVICIFVIVTLAICLIIFIQRIFEVLLLYIVSPYFVAMMPLDDGERFSRWRELFIGKCFTGFGSVAGMRLYLMVVPMIMDNTIRFELGSSPEAGYFLKLFFLAGGAWAVYKMGPMVTSILSQQTGQEEAATGSLVGGALIGATAGRLMGRGKAALAAAAANRGKKEGEEDGTNSRSRGETQAFRGPGAGKTSRTGGGPGGSRKSFSSVSRGKDVRSRRMWGGLYSSEKTEGKTTRRSVGMGLYRREDNRTDGTSTRRYLGGLGTSVRDRDGKTVSRSITPLLSVGKGSDGTWRITKLSVPGIARIEGGADGGRRLTNLHIPGVVRASAFRSGTKLKVTDIPLLGSHVQRDETGKIISGSIMGGAYRSVLDEKGGKTFSFLGVERYHAGRDDELYAKDRRQGGRNAMEAYPRPARAKVDLSLDGAVGRYPQTGKTGSAADSSVRKPAADHKPAERRGGGENQS